MLDQADKSPQGHQGCQGCLQKHQRWILKLKIQHCEEEPKKSHSHFDSSQRWILCPTNPTL